MESSKKQAVEPARRAAGRFASGLGDLARRHDDYFAETMPRQRRVRRPAGNVNGATDDRAE